MSFLKELTDLKKAGALKLKPVDEVAVRQKDGSIRYERKDGKLVRFVASDTASASDNDFSVYGFIANRTPDLEVAIVRPFLAFGSEDAACDESILLEAGITHVINLVASICPNQFPAAFTYLCLTLCDLPDQDLSTALPACCEFIDAARAAGGRCFVHCNAGRSRAPSIVLGYLIRREGLTYAEAVVEVSRERYIVPNYGFRLQLQKLSTAAANTATSGVDSAD